MVVGTCSPSHSGGQGRRIAWIWETDRSCSGPRFHHCTPAWAVRARLRLKKKKKTNSSFHIQNNCNDKLRLHFHNFNKSNKFFLSFLLLQYKFSYNFACLAPNTFQPQSNSTNTSHHMKRQDTNPNQVTSVPNSWPNGTDRHIHNKATCESGRGMHFQLSCVKRKLGKHKVRCCLCFVPTSWAWSWAKTDLLENIFVLS